MQSHNTTIEQDVADVIEDYAKLSTQIFPTVSTAQRKLMRVVITLACGDAIDVEEVMRAVQAKADRRQAMDNAAV